MCPVLSCAVLSVCLSVLSVCDVGVLWPDGWMDQDETWHAGRPRPMPHCFRWDPTPLPHRGTAPQFPAHICCGKMAGWIKTPLGRDVGVDPSNIVLDVRWRPSSPKFSAHVCCVQMAGWIKMSLGTKVGLGPHHIVLHGDPRLLWPNGHPSQLLLSTCSFAQPFVKRFALCYQTVVCPVLSVCL